MASAEDDYHVPSEYFISPSELASDDDDNFVPPKFDIPGQKEQFLHLLREIDSLTETFEGITSPENCQILKTEFNADSLEEAFSSFDGVQKEVALMVLQQVFPSRRIDFAQLSNLQLKPFRSNYKIANYIDAVIKSGVAADVDHGIVFLVGNTGVGKTSLANSLKAYVENPNDNPASILAGIGQYKSLIETQVLEVYKDVAFQRRQDMGVKVTNKEGQPSLVNFTSEPNN